MEYRITEIRHRHNLPTTSTDPDSLWHTAFVEGFMMRQFAKIGFVALVSTAVLQVGTSAVLSADPAPSPIPATPPFASPDIKPTLADWATARPVALWKKVLTADPLQKPPFVGQPPDSLKGMAAGIRAVQLDIPNRVKAAAYLGTVDCVTYPQAQAMLVATMQEDPAEEVRYEAVMALRNMLSRGCTNMNTDCECESCRPRKKSARETARHSKKAQLKIVHEAKCHAKFAAIKAMRQSRKDPRFDCCRGCCNEKATKALAAVAYEKDDQCCWVEPSARVRQAAAEGLTLCCSSPDDAYSLPGMYVDPSSSIAPVPADDESKSGMKEETPAEEQEAKPLEEDAKPIEKEAIPVEELKPTAVKTSLPTLQSVAAPPAVVTARADTKTFPAIKAFNGFCVVGLKQRQFNRASDEFHSVFEGHTFFFATREAKTEFDKNPALYGPAYGGIDPVVWLERHEMVEGQFLREFEGRFYLFADKDAWETFKATPARFVLRSTKSSNQVVSQ